MFCLIKKWIKNKEKLLTQFIKESFHPIVSHYRTHQSGLQKRCPFVHQRLLTTLIILSIHTIQTQTIYRLNFQLRLRCAAGFSPGTHDPLWPPHLDSHLPQHPDSSLGRRNRVCHRSSPSCQESVASEQILVLEINRAQMK